MISVSQLYPLREVEEFTISPERQLAKEMAEAKRRVQDASTVRRLVTTESVADGTVLHPQPAAATSASTCATSSRSGCTTTRPGGRRYWQNNMAAPLVWDVDKAAYTPAALVRHIVGAGDRDQPGRTSGPSGGATPAGWTLAELAGPLGGGKGALYRDFWSRWLEKVRLRHPHWTAHVDPAGAELHHAALPRSGAPTTG